MSNNTLTVGKIRGLSSTSSPNGTFKILAFDHRQSFIKMLAGRGQADLSFGEVVEAKSSTVKILAPYASAVLLDPVYSAAYCIADGSLPGRTGLLVALEETGYSGSDVGRVTTLVEGWSVEKIKRMGTDAVKLLVFYHPEAGETTHGQEELVEKVVEACRQADIPLFLEAVTYSITPGLDKNSAEFAGMKPGLVVETARRLGRFSPEVLKLEFPVDPIYNTNEADWARACDAVSQASPCPWAVLSAGVDYRLFHRQVEVACKHGASGYIAGRAVWQEGISLPTGERQAWLQDIAAHRLESLNEIADRFARPWRDFYPNLESSMSAGWYQRYS